MVYSAPQVAGRDEPFRSEIREHLKGRTEALEDLAVELLARGLSVRDIEDAFRDETGRLLLSKTAVSEIGERLWADYQEFATRDLGEYEIAYLFVDGIAERVTWHLIRFFLNLCGAVAAFVLSAVRGQPCRTLRA